MACIGTLTGVDIGSLSGHIDGCQYGRGMIGAMSASRTELPPLDTAVARCCSTEGGAPLTRGDADVVARLLKAVADPVRLQILSIVRCSEGGEVCACDLPTPLGLAQPTVSHHLRILVEAGLLTRERRGPWAWFALVPERLELARQALSS